MERGIDQTTISRSTGDAAVSGMFRGLLGGMAMAAVIAVASLAAGQGLAYLGYFSAGSPVPPLQGVSMHLAVSSTYGMLYSLLRYGIGEQRLARVPGWVTGLVYAMLLWTFAVRVLLPAADARILGLPWWVFFAGHIAYGIVLGVRQK